MLSLGLGIPYRRLRGVVSGGGGDSVEEFLVLENMQDGTTSTGDVIDTVSQEAGNGTFTLGDSVRADSVGSSSYVNAQADNIVGTGIRENVQSPWSGANIGATISGIFLLHDSTEAVDPVQKMMFVEVNPDDSNANNNAVEVSYDLSNSFVQVLTAGDKITGNGNTYLGRASLGSFADGQFHRMTVSVDPTQGAILYVDGVAITFDNTAYADLGAGASIAMGAITGVDESVVNWEVRYNGGNGSSETDPEPYQVGDVRVYSYALDATAVGNLPAATTDAPSFPYVQEGNLATYDTAVGNGLIEIHSGLTATVDSTVTQEYQFGSELTVNGNGDLVEVEDGATGQEVAYHDGITATISKTVEYPDASFGRFRGATFDLSGNFIAYDSGSNEIIQFEGETTTVLSRFAFPAAGGSSNTGLAVDSNNNLVILAATDDTLYQLDGISSTVLNSFTISDLTSNAAGITVDRATDRAVIIDVTTSEAIVCTGINVTESSRFAVQSGATACAMR